MTPLDILKAVIGALIGISLPYIFKSIIYVFRRFHRSRLEGKWFVYHITNEQGQLKIILTAWIISKGLMTPFTVKDEKMVGDKLIKFAKGTLHRERNFLIVHLKAVEHKEEITIRLLDPITSSDDITWGLWLSYDLQGDLIAGPVVMSRIEIDENTFLNFIKNKVKAFDNMKTLTSYPVSTHKVS